MRITLNAVVFLIGCSSGNVFGTDWSIATFSADITIPIGHRCMGVLETKSKQINDPLEAHGLIIQGSGPAMILLALDWCEVRNDSYEQWRLALAKAANTSIEHVMVCALHQHDAPVVDAGAQAYLDANGLHNELFDKRFHQRCVSDVVESMKQAMNRARPLTRIGFGMAPVEQIASNRRVEYRDGRVSFDRYSRTAMASPQAQAAEGEIDPDLRALVFFDHDSPVATLTCYATHPMSSYGNGVVSGDFVALARRRHQQESPGNKQIYVTGCSGDVTAGKYNDGSPSMKTILADRLLDAMRKATQNAMKPAAIQPVSEKEIGVRCEKLVLPYHSGKAFRRPALMETLTDASASVEKRITAAMSLSSLDRVEKGIPIDLPIFDLGVRKIILLPGEAFVGYQLMAQSMDESKDVITIGYGECWTGYIPTENAFREGFDHDWRWVASGCEHLIEAKLQKLLSD